VRAIAHFISRRSLIYHLHDIVSSDHFSATNHRIIITLANRSSLIIANSQASRDAFIQAGGCADCIHVVYNGFRPENYIQAAERDRLRQQLNLSNRFVVGNFSRLSPWKGQHVLIEALSQCPTNVCALLVGDALFGEDDYVAKLHQLAKTLGLEDRVQFLGFRHDIPQLMAACDLVAHTSTVPEPFGRVIVEAMLCGTPVIASAAGGAQELLENGRTGWLCPSGDVHSLAELINYYSIANPLLLSTVAVNAQGEATERFNLQNTNQKIGDLLQKLQKFERVENK
jgi:glycosyltransferase involved in cell wall biosynthesis